MTVPLAISRYLKDHAEKDGRPLCSGSLEGIERAVVIPAFAERDSLFSTVASLADNPPEELLRTLVVCVVNNRRPGIADTRDIEDNRETMEILKDIIAGRSPAPISPEPGMTDAINRIGKGGLRLACLDASSEGYEMPARNGGVGMARKLGMDRALALFEYSSGATNLLYCLDADTLVERNYLAGIQDHFNGSRAVAAVASYAHQEAVDSRLAAAACCYEIYLRYYVAGLAYAVSPYAFHTIGSTMTCRAEAYASVRGMVRRDAAEDFYFLNKLAKIGHIGKVKATRVYPSSRASSRVPFGTGRRMISYRQECPDEYRLYDPDIFFILKRWLREMMENPDRSPGQIGKSAGDISPFLAAYLDTCSFGEAWEKVRMNNSNPDILRKQFHVWFDAFKTLKFVHYLTERGMAKIPMCNALDRLLQMTGNRYPLSSCFPGIPTIEDQRVLLDYLRNETGC